MDWIWIIVAVISIVASLMEQAGKNKKPSAPRPWVSNPESPSVLTPSDNWPTIMEIPVHRGETTTEGESMEEASWEEETPVLEMVAPEMASEEGESTWSEQVSEEGNDASSEEISGVYQGQSETLATLKTMDGEDELILDDDNMAKGAAFIPEHIVEAVIFSEALARPGTRRRWIR